MVFQTFTKVHVDTVLYIDYDTTNNNTATKLGYSNWSGCSSQWDDLKVTTTDDTNKLFGIGTKDIKLIKTNFK